MLPRITCMLVAMLGVTAVQADEFVDRADANGDGFVSLYELRAAHYADVEFNKRIEESFASYDSNGDGLISEAERRAKHAASSNTAPPELGVQGTNDTGTVPAATVSYDASSQPINSEQPPMDDNSVAPSDAANVASLSRSESWILQIDADNSGGASVAELVESGDGKQWFTDSAFESADVNGDHDLDPAELEVLLQSMERRRR
jgi:hypothetical protein